MAEKEKKQAIPTLIRGPDGLMHTVYVDAKTGEVLPSLNGYTVITASKGEYYDPSKKEEEEPIEDEETQTDRVLDVPEGGRSGAVDAHGYKFGKANNNPTDNFGYISKPTAVRLAGYLPGIVGGIAKVTNAGINLNNMDAVDKARKGLGLESTKKNIGSVAKGAIKDNKGQISNNAKIGNNNYSIGFEALSPSGKTNLTYNEAKLREALSQSPITEATTPTKAAESKKESRFSKITGIKSGWATRALDKVFGITPDDAPTPSSKPTVTSEPFADTVNGVGFVGNFGPNRPNRPSVDIVDAVRENVAKTFGPGYSVVGISGQEDPGEQYGSPRHKTGLALDFDVVDPSGRKVTDIDALNDMAAGFAYSHPEAGIGFGQGYMTDLSGQPGRMHLDLSGYGKNWGAANTVRNMDPALAQTIDAARQGFRPTPFSNAPTPTAKPDPDTSLNPVGETLDPVEHNSILSQVGSPQASIGRQITAENLSPARMATMGFVSRTPTQKQAIAQAIAGELSQESLKGLVAGDPVAKQELANIATTIENRAASKMFSSLEDALNPSSYNSLDPANMGVTQDNNQRYSAALQASLDDFYSGKLSPTSYQATSYYNPDIANPAWGAQMANPTKVGNHLFGSLPEYSPDNAAQKAIDAFGRMSGTSFNPGKAKDNTYDGGLARGSGYSGYGGLDSPSEGHAGRGPGTSLGGGSSGRGYGTGIGTGSSFGGAPGQSGGAGYSPGGMNSPSGSSYGGGGGGLGRSAGSEASHSSRSTEHGSVGRGGGHYAA